MIPFMLLTLFYPILGLLYYTYFTLSMFLKNMTTRFQLSFCNIIIHKISLLVHINDHVVFVSDINLQFTT